eukprot:gene7901-9276_t
MNTSTLIVLLLCIGATLSININVDNVISTEDAVDDSAFCSTCVSYMREEIKNLVNSTLNGGATSCKDLCSHENSTLLPVCVNLCDTIGFEVFIKIFEMVEPDPIYACVELSLCPILDSGNGTVLAVTTVPASGPLGTTFTVTAGYSIASPIGTGMVQTTVYLPGGNGTLLQQSLIVELPAGKYTNSFTFTSDYSDDVPFVPGTYVVQVLLCEGTCQSTHPHSILYSLLRGEFIITGDSTSGTGSSGSGQSMYYF